MFGDGRGLDDQEVLAQSCFGFWFHGSGERLAWTLSRVESSHAHSVCNLEFLLDSQLLFEEPVLTVARESFVQLCLVCQLGLLLDLGTLLIVTPAFSTFCLDGAALEVHLETMTGPECQQNR